MSTKRGHLYGSTHTKGTKSVCYVSDAFLNAREGNKQKSLRSHRASILALAMLVSKGAGVLSNRMQVFLSHWRGHPCYEM